MREPTSPSILNQQHSLSAFIDQSTLKEFIGMSGSRTESIDTQENLLNDREVSMID